MSSRGSDNRLLREYVAKILCEDDGGDVAADLMAGAAGGMPYGMSYGSGSDLYKVFVEPFVDVFKVAGGKTKELSTRAQTLGKTALKAMITSLIPTIADDYEKIFAEERRKLDSIRREYGDAYDRVWAAFEHDDVKVLSFFYDPFAAGAMLGYFGGKAAINTALDVVDSLSGGALNHLLVRNDKKTKRRSPIEQGVGGDVDEGIVLEQDESTDDVGTAVKKALSTPEAKKAISTAREAVQSSLKTVARRAQGLRNARSLADLEKIGFRPKPEAMSALNGLPAEERTPAETQIIANVKRAGLEFYAKNLEGQLKKALSAGVPEKSAYVRDYRKIITKIKGS